MTTIGLRALREMRALLQGKGGLIAGSFAHIGGKGPGDDHKEWARILRVREESGEYVTPYQADAWRRALGGEKV